MKAQFTKSLSPEIKQARAVNIFSLFTSGSTLICCALPATMVAIGSAATLTSLVSNFPQLVWVSEHKSLVFGVAGATLLLAGVLQFYSQNAPCPVDPALAAVCTKTRQQAIWIYCLSLLLFLVGAFFAFIAPLFL